MIYVVVDNNSIKAMHGILYSYVFHNGIGVNVVTTDRRTDMANLKKERDLPTLVAYDE